MPSPPMAKFQDALPTPPVAAPIHVHPDGTRHYVIEAGPVSQQLNQGLPGATDVWGFNGTYPGPTIETHAGHPIVVDWVNNLPPQHLIQPVLSDADAQHQPGRPPVRMITHLHGGHTPPESDGHPLDFFAPGRYRRDSYPITQQAGTLWYHDHAMDATRYNVYAGLAGFFLIRDHHEAALNLPKAPYEIPLVLQDRLFDASGQLQFVTSLDAPEFYGDTPVLNGVAYPVLDAEPRAYRFRVLNGSNARFYTIQFSTGLTFHVIGSDGGLLDAPVPVTALRIGPGERYDLFVDFAPAAGTEMILQNTDKNNDPAIPELMKVRVAAGPATPTAPPASLRPLPPLPAPAPRRIFVIDELDPSQSAMGMRMPLINAMGFHDPITEAPVLGTTEDWTFYNKTGDDHPMHLHLIQFRVVGRILAANPDTDDPPLPPADPRHPLAMTSPPDPHERGWKDTVIVPGKSVTQIRVTFAHDDYTGRYVWHCHILEHEEMDMMRPLIVLPASFSSGPPMPTPMGMAMPMASGPRSPLPTG